MRGGTFFDRIFSYIFPEYCLGCEQEGTLVCGVCAEVLNVYEVCSGELRHRAFWVYDGDGVRAKLIKVWKYQFRKKAFQYIAPTLKRFVEDHNEWFQGIQMIVPIPLHPKREVWRGFNQAELIARELSGLLNIPCVLFLERTRVTAPQASLGKEKRATNVGGAFAVRKGAHIENLTFLLVDDVFTTGSTLDEAARTLLNAGAKEVKLFTLCKDELQPPGG